MSCVTGFGCPSGGTPYLYPNLNLPLSCVIGSQCPQGYSCQRSLSANQYYCCPTRRLISDGPNERPKRSLFFDHLNQNSNSCHLSKSNFYYLVYLFYIKKFVFYRNECFLMIKQIHITFNKLLSWYWSVKCLYLISCFFVGIICWINLLMCV